MKNSLFFLLIKTFIVFTIPLQAQELPIKNGHIYYKLQHKMKNQNKCVVRYFRYTMEKSSEFAISNQEFNNIIHTRFRPKLNELNTSKKKKFNLTYLDYGNFEATIFPYIQNLSGNNKSCTDTTTQIPLFISPPIKINDLLKFTNGYELITLFSDKVVSQKVKAVSEVRIINKNEYELIVKGFFIEFYFQSGKTMELPLGKLYEAYKKDTNKPYELTRLFTYIDEMVMGYDKIIEEIVTELIEVDELD